MCCCLCFRLIELACLLLIYTAYSYIPGLFLYTRLLILVHTSLGDSRVWQIDREFMYCGAPTGERFLLNVCNNNNKLNIKKSDLCLLKILCKLTLDSKITGHARVTLVC